MCYNRKTDPIAIFMRVAVIGGRPEPSAAWFGRLPLCLSPPPACRQSMGHVFGDDKVQQCRQCHSRSVAVRWASRLGSLPARHCHRGGGRGIHKSGLLLLLPKRIARAGGDLLLGVCCVPVRAAALPLHWDCLSARCSRLFRPDGSAPRMRAGERCGRSVLAVE